MSLGLLLVLSHLTLGFSSPESDADIDRLASHQVRFDELMRGKQYAEAESEIRAGLQVIRSILGEDSEAYGSALQGLALSLSLQGRHEEAVAAHRQSIDVLVVVLGVGDPLVGERAFNAGSYAMDDAADPRSALAFLQTALLSFETSEDFKGVGAALNRMGLTRRLLGEYDLARQNLERSVAVLKGLDPHALVVAHGLNNLALVLQDLGEAAGARKALEEALVTYEALGIEDDMVSVLMNNLATIAFDQKDFERSADLFDRSIAMYRGSEKNRAILLHNRATQLVRSSQYPTARGLFEEARAILLDTVGPDHIQVANLLASMGELNRREGDLETARTQHQRSLEIRQSVLGANHPDIAVSLNNLAHIASQMDDFETAIELQRKALEMLETTFAKGHPRTVGSISTLSKIQLAGGDIEGARSSIAQAQRIASAVVRADSTAMSERQGRAYAKGFRHMFYAFVDLFDRDADVDEAYRAVLQWKGVQTDILARRRAAFDLNDPEVVASHDELLALRDEKAELLFAGGPDRADQMTRLADQIEILERQVASRSADMAAELSRREATVIDVCEAMPPHSELVDLLRIVRTDGSPTFVAFVIDADTCGVRRVDLGDARQIERAVYEWRSVLITSPSGHPQLQRRVDGRGERLHDLLWAPLGISSDHVLVAPDGLLAAVSVAALPAGNGRYVLEQVQITYLESALDLIRWRDDSPRWDGALLVGGLDYGESDGPIGAPCVEESYQPLPGTEVELVAIASSWRRRSGSILRLGGDEATERAVVEASGRHGVVHFATHGFYAGGACSRSLVDPMLMSGIVLSGVNDSSNREGALDGILTAQEVADLDFSGTSLVVLSACKTGLGRYQSGASILGLRRGFLAAGAHTLVTALWDVPDAATADLMRDFYRARLRGGLSSSAALREAQLRMLHHNRGKYGDARPVDWAGFIAAGDWR